jgi:predicted RNase H-like HicB family nuclease
MHYEIVGDPYCWSHAIPEMPGAHTQATSVAG